MTNASSLPGALPSNPSAVRHIRVTRNGQFFSATWQVESKLLRVTSVYGSKAEPVTTSTNLNARAMFLLGQIADAWRPTGSDSWA
jgi:hypothetical protein